MRSPGLRWLFRVLAVGVIATVCIVAVRHADDVIRALRLARSASLAWVVVGLLATVSVYCVRGAAFGVALRAMGFAVPISFLTRTAMIATVVGQLLPAAGVSGYAYSVSAFRRRGVPAGQASLVALLELVSYAFSVGTVFVIALASVAASGRLPGRTLFAVVIPGMLVAGGAAWAYAIQRDRARCLRTARSWAGRLRGVLGRVCSYARVRAFLDQYYAGKATIERRRLLLLRLVALQGLSLGLDVLTLYVMFLALGSHPSIVAVIVGFILAMGGLAAVSLPAGGGSFEMILASCLATQGIAPSVAIAATLLFRLVAFWLPSVAVATVLVIARRRPATMTAQPRGDMSAPGGAGWPRSSDTSTRTVNPA